mgnify:CR=1 FL=1
MYCFICGFFFQAEDGIRDLVRSRGLGDVYKRQDHELAGGALLRADGVTAGVADGVHRDAGLVGGGGCLLYTSDAADDLLCVDLGGRRIIKKKTHTTTLHLPSTSCITNP